MHDARHLSTEELLLYSDGELTPDRAAHIAHCALCSAELADLSGFLFRVEDELRAATPARQSSRPSASWSRIESHIYAPLKHERRGFPVYWTAMYATAAALTFAVLGGYMTSQVSAPQPAVELAVAAPAAPAVERMVIRSAMPALQTELPALRAELPAVTTEFTVPEPAAAAPRAQYATYEVPPAASPAIAAEPLLTASAPQVQLAQPLSLDPAALTPRLSMPPAPPAAPVRDPSQLAKQYWQLAQASEWRQNAAPVPAFAGSPVAARTTSLVGSPTGLVRSSLVAHYSDAARRSFVSPSPAVVEGEIQRFVSDVLDQETALLEHSYALRQALDAIGDEAQLDAEGQHALRRLIEFHTRAMQQRETAIYARLSETLPRRYWSYRGEEAAAAARPLPAVGRELMATVSGLDRELTALLAGGAVTLDVETGARSTGAWLADLRGQLRALRARAKTLR